METRRSSTVQQNRMEKSTKSSSIQRRQSSRSSMNVVPIDHQRVMTTKNSLQSCPFRMEDVDRHAIIKHEDTMSSLNRLSMRDDVRGVIVTTMDGRILYDCDALKNWIPSLTSLCFFARHLVRNEDPNDSIQSLRLRTRTYELLLTVHNEQLLVVMKMLPDRNEKEKSTEDNIIEEDWNVFLRRLQQQKLENSI